MTDGPYAILRVKPLSWPAVAAMVDGQVRGSITLTKFVQRRIGSGRVESPRLHATGDAASQCNSQEERACRLSSFEANVAHFNPAGWPQTKKKRPKVRMDPEFEKLLLDACDEASCACLRDRA